MDGELLTSLLDTENDDETIVVDELTDLAGESEGALLCTVRLGLTAMDNKLLVCLRETDTGGEIIADDEASTDLSENIESVL